MKWNFPIKDGQLLIEHARQSDAESVFQLHREVLAERAFFITEPQEFQSSASQKSRIIWDFRHSHNAAYWVGRSRDEIVGFLAIQGGTLNRMSHVAKLEVMVAPAHRGRKIGKCLMKACIEWAEQNDKIEKIGLSVFASNERAIAMYRAFGFEEEGRRVREYRFADGSYRDDLLMYRFV